MRNVLDTKVSYFNGSKGVVPVGEVELFKLLTTAKYKSTVDQVRLMEDKGRRDALKATLPSFTPSCTCSYRSQDKVKAHSGLLQFDIDEKDNSKWMMADLRDILRKEPNIAYCGLSVSGRGLWGVIPIAFPEHHKAHFEFVRKWFEKHGVIIDPAPSSVVSLRFLSYDENAHFNCYAEPLEQYHFEVPRAQARPFRSAGEPRIWEQYNQTDDFERVLLEHGWQIEKNKGNKVYYTRAGKAHGVSAEFDSDKGLLFVFTSSTEFEGNQCYTPFGVYAHLEHGGDFKKAAKALMRD